MEKPEKNVKNMLISAKDTSELMLDLAYAAVFFNDRDIVEEVIDLEKKMSEIVDDLHVLCILAGRSPEDAQQISTILHIVMGIEKIGDEASEIARVVTKELGIPEELLLDLRHAEEVVGRTMVGEESPLQNIPLRKLNLAQETGMWIIAIRRDKEWIIGPGGDDVLYRGDVLIVQGSEEGLESLSNLARSPLPRGIAIPETKTPLPGLEQAVDLVVELKNLAEVAVDLAYSCLLFQDKGLAAEVSDMEDQSDDMQRELEKWVLTTAKDYPRPENLRGLIQLARASEAIVDASRGMTSLTEKEKPVHPVITVALQETLEVVMRQMIDAGSKASGMSLKQFLKTTKLGLSPLAIQRGRRWFCRPRPDFILKGEDLLIVTGPPESEKKLKQLCRVKSNKLKKNMKKNGEERPWLE
jgi:uncharacterized protein with PhoU and TrkA domain